MSAELTAEEQAWEKSARMPARNPIIRAMVDTVLSTVTGSYDDEDGIRTVDDALTRWVEYMANGDQEISWYPPLVEQANAWLEETTRMNGVKYRPGMTAPARA